MIINNQYLCALQYITKIVKSQLAELSDESLSLHRIPSLNVYITIILFESSRKKIKKCSAFANKLELIWNKTTLAILNCSEIESTNDINYSSNTPPLIYSDIANDFYQDLKGGQNKYNTYLCHAYWYSY